MACFKREPLQLAAAFDEQSNDLQSLQAVHGDAMRKLEELQMKAKLDGETQNKLAIRADLAEAEVQSARRRCADLERHIDDMRSALTQAHAQIEILQCEKKRQTEGSMLETSRLREDITANVELILRLREENASLHTQLALTDRQGLAAKKGADGTAPPLSPPTTANLKSAQSKGRSPKGGRNVPKS